MTLEQLESTLRDEVSTSATSRGQEFILFTDSDSLHKMRGKVMYAPGARGDGLGAMLTLSIDGCLVHCIPNLIAKSKVLCKVISIVK